MISAREGEWEKKDIYKINNNIYYEKTTTTTTITARTTTNTLTPGKKLEKKQKWKME